MSSLNPFLFPPLPVQKIRLNPISYHQEREDIARPTTTPFVSGQCSLDADRDKFFFSLFTAGWVDRKGECNPEKEWPAITSFRAEEHTYIKDMLKKKRLFQCTFEGEIISGSFNLATLFSHLRMFQQKHQQNLVPWVLYLIGSELQEIEHKYDWSFENLLNLSGIEIPPALIEAIKKRTSGDSDWRFYPGGNVTPELIKRCSVEIINFFTHCLYWEERNKKLRSEYDQQVTQHYLSYSPEWEKLREAIYKNGFLKFNFYDSESQPESKNEPKMCYATVAFKEPHTKPVDILLIKNLNANCLFSVDDCQLRLNALTLACEDEIRTRTFRDTSKEYRLQLESERQQNICTWQHLTDQLTYSIRGHRPEIYTTNVILIYLSHCTKGGRPSSIQFEKELMQKLSIKELPDHIAEYHRKHPSDLHFKQAYAITTLFALIRLKYPSEDIGTFWKEISSTVSEQPSSLFGLITQALKQPEISPECIYHLIHLLSFINLGAPKASKHPSYLYFQEENAVFEILEKYTLTTKGDILTTLEELQGLSRITSAKSLNCLQKLIDHLLPQQLASPDQETVLKFYRDALKLDYSQIDRYAQKWLHSEPYPMTQLLGLHLTFLCSSSIPGNVSLKKWIAYSVEQPHLKSLIATSLVPTFDKTPQQNLKKALESFACNAPDWMETLIVSVDRETIQEVTEIVSELATLPDNHLSLIKRLGSFDTQKAWAYFVKIESTLSDTDWIQSLGHFNDDLRKTTDVNLIRRTLNLILDRKLSSNNYPFHSTFIALTSKLAEIEGPYAADLFLFRAIEKGMITSQTEQTVSLCTKIFDAYLLKDVPKALEFWEKTEKKSIWKELPSDERNRHILTLAQIGRESLTGREVEIIHKRVVNEVAVQINRINFKRADEIAKEFAKLLTPQDRASFLLQRGKKYLETQQWVSALDTLKELLKTSHPEKVPFAEEVLKAFLDHRVSLFGELLMNPELDKILDKPFLRSLALQYLKQRSRSSSEISLFLVFLLKNLDPQTVQEKELLELLEHIHPLLEQVREPLSAGLIAQLTEKKSALIPTSPVLMVRFLSGLQFRKIPITFPKKINGRIYSQMLQFLQESKECDKIHSLLMPLKEQLIISEQVIALVAELTTQFLDRKAFQKAELWIPHIVDEGLLIKCLQTFVANNHTSPVSVIFERLKKSLQRRSQIHPIIKTLAYQAHSSPAQVLGLLIDFDYPASALWRDTLDKLRTVKKQEPRFLKILQSNPQFLDNFTGDLGILHDCLFFAIEALCNHSSPELVDFCHQKKFWLPLTLKKTQKHIMSPKQRIAIFENLLHGLLTCLKTHSNRAEIEGLLWDLEQERANIFASTNEEDLPIQPPGLGWNKTIADTLIRCGNTEASQKIYATVTSRIELDQLTLECIRDVESLAMLALKKDVGLPFLQLFVVYSARFLPYINLENIFNALANQQNPQTMVRGFQLIHQVLGRIEEKNINRNTQKAIINFAAKAAVPNSPRIDVYPILFHKRFHYLTHFRGELFTQIFILQCVQIAQFEDKDAVPKTLSCLFLRIKDLSQFPEGEKQCVETAFSLLLGYLGQSGNTTVFYHYYLKLLEATSDLTGESSLELQSHQSMSSQPSSLPEYKSDKFFHFATHMTSKALKLVYPAQLTNKYLLEFVWGQFFYLCKTYPEKHKELLPLMENALYTPWISQQTDLDKLQKEIRNCIAFCVDSGAFKDDVKMLFRFSVFIELQVDMTDFQQVGDVELPIELLKVVERMIETKHIDHVARVILLLKRFHTIRTVASFGGVFYTEKNPKRMLKIYNDLIDLIIQDPFFQMTPLITEAANVPKTSINAIYYNFTQMLSLNEHFDISNWKQETVQIISTWVATLRNLCEKHEDQQKELYSCMLAFLLASAKKGRFQFFSPEYILLVNQVVGTYLTILKSIPLKNVAFLGILREFSPIALFQLPSKQDDPLLKKAFANFITSLGQIKHPKMKAFIAELQTKK